MKKEAAFIAKRRREWEKTSAKFRALFETEKDPAVISSFLEKTQLALKEPWVTAAIMTAMFEGRHEFIKAAFRGATNKKKSSAKETKIRSLMTVIAVDVQRARGLTIEKAVQRVCDLYRQIEGYSTIDRVLNQYKRGRRIHPEIYIDETNGRRVITAGPAKIGLSGARLEGLWEAYRRVSPETLPLVQELFDAGDNTCFVGRWTMHELEGKTRIDFDIYWPK